MPRQPLKSIMNPWLAGNAISLECQGSSKSLSCSSARCDCLVVCDSIDSRRERVDWKGSYKVREVSYRSLSNCDRRRSFCFRLSAITQPEAKAHDDKYDLHGADENVDDPSAPAAETDAEDHVDAEDPGVLNKDLHQRRNLSVQE